MAIAASTISNTQTLEEFRLEFNKLQSDVNTLESNPTFGTSIIFEGATADAYETTLTVTDPTADRTITLPNVTGTVITTGDTGTVSGTMIANDAIDSSHYTDGSIDLAHMSVNSIDSDQYVDGSIDVAHMAANSVDSAQYVDGSIDTVHIDDNQVTLAKLAGIARGKIIYGDASGDPAVLAVGSADQILTHDGTDVAWADAATATLATSVTVSANNSTNETVYPVFVDGATGTQGAETDTGLTYNPSSGLLTSTGFSGNLTGTLQTAAQGNVTSVGALDGGSITSGFGAIDNGTSNIRSATITAETAFVPDASDGAALGTTSLEFSDLFLADGGIIYFGDDQEITLTHVADDGLILKHVGTGDGKEPSLTFQAGDNDIAVDDVLGSIFFQAPDEGAGTDAILVAAGIEAVSEGDFSSTNNATSLVFKTGASETATAKVKITSEGHLIPAADDTHDLGTSTIEWRNAYFDGTVTSDAFAGPLTGNATTATALATGRTIASTGDVVWTSASFDGSGNVTGTAAIGSGVIVVGDMAANSIDSAQYVDGSIDLIHMSANSVDSAQYVDDSIDTAHYAAGSVDATALGADCVTAAKIGDNVINSEHYAADSIDEEHIANDAVGSAELKTLSTLLIKNSSGSTLKTIYGAGA